MRGGKKQDLSRIKPYIPVRRAQENQRIDREQWADTTQVVFPVRINGSGEYLTEEPIMFGQAYESPPFFNFSNLASGVSVRPEVRAIGWPVGEPCVDTPTYGANVLRDPGFERVDYYPKGNEIPLNVGNNWTDSLRWSDNSIVSANNVGWQVYSANEWLVSGANPRTGTKHLRTTVTATHIYAVGGLFCGRAVDWESQIPSAFVAAGDSVRFAVHAMTSGTASLQMVLTPADIEGSIDTTSSVVSTKTITTSYAKHEISRVIPSVSSGSGLLLGQVNVGFRVTALSGTLDVDDAELEVIAG